MAYAQNEMASPEAGRGIPRELSGDEIEEFLRSQRIARLGCHAAGTTYVVPLIYAYEAGAVVAVTSEGRKTAMLRENPRVCVEVDEYDADGKGSWRSVIAYGDYEELSAGAVEPALALLRERFARTAGRAAEPRPLGPNVVVLRINLTEISGRTVER
jgi:nitroimidazol reductase NimA-like FMN-containing flavoprotein (pyridoxamine 5'-phosphate oxidase superfamily)